MVRRIEPTKLVDECKFDPACPFDCPLVMCVKEYPGGAASYVKDSEIKRLLREGKDTQEIAVILGLSQSSVERRYVNANLC